MPENLDESRTKALENATRNLKAILVSRVKTDHADALLKAIHERAAHLRQARGGAKIPQAHLDFLCEVITDAIYIHAQARERDAGWFGHLWQDFGSRRPMEQIATIVAIAVFLVGMGNGIWILGANFIHPAANSPATTATTTPSLPAAAPSSELHAIPLRTGR